MGDLYDLVRLPKNAYEPDGHMAPRILLIDIESTDLKADFGWMMGFGWQWYGEDKVHTIGIHQTKPFLKGRVDDDSELTRLAYELITQADSVVFHYGDRFDMKFIKTRLLAIGLYLPKIHTVDTWMVSRSNLLLQRNSMAKIAEFVGGQQKGHEGMMVWRKARLGHVPSIRKIMKYCAQDIRTLHSVFEKLRPYCKMVNHNEFYAVKGCKNCGSQNYKMNGKKYRLGGIVQEYQCNDCSTYFTATKKHPIPPAQRRGR